MLKQISVRCSWVLRRIGFAKSATCFGGESFWTMHQVRGHRVQSFGERFGILGYILCRAVEEHMKRIRDEMTWREFKTLWCVQTYLVDLVIWNTRCTVIQENHTTKNVLCFMADDSDEGTPTLTCRLFRREFKMRVRQWENDNERDVKEKSVQNVIFLFLAPNF